MDNNIKKPKVTVIMPAFNVEKYIGEAIESILSQTFGDFELLIINDGSTDGTAKIINRYYDDRIRVLNNEINLGIVGARNRGLQESRGEYIAMLDSDDVAHQKRLEKQVDFMETHPDFGLVGTWVRVISDTGQPTGTVWSEPTIPEKIPMRLLFGNCFTQSSVMIRQSVLAEEGYRSGYAPAEDYDLWVRIAQKYKMWNLPEVLVHYRVHGNNSVKRDNSTQIKIVNEIISSQLKNLGVYPTAEQLRTHKTGYYFSGEDLKEFVDDRERWLRGLKKANAEVEFYPEPEFSQVIGERWLTTCRANTREGYMIWKKFWDSVLADNLNKRKEWVSLLKLFLKCLIRKDDR